MSHEDLPEEESGRRSLAKAPGKDFTAFPIRAELEDQSLDLMLLTVALSPVNLPHWRLDVFHEHSPKFLSENMAKSQAEAASTMLERQSHELECRLTVRQGKTDGEVRLTRLTVTDAMRRTYADGKDAISHGALAMSLLAAEQIHGFKFVQQVRGKGPGFDYYLSRKPNIFSIGEARLEVSGIEDGDDKDLGKRISEKRKQINDGNAREPQEPGTRFYIGIFSAGQPLVYFAEHKPKPPKQKKTGISGK